MASRLFGESRSEKHGTDDGARVRLEEVGPHARNVADIVCDRRRISMIVLRDSHFDLAHEIGTRSDLAATDSKRCSVAGAMTAGAMESSGSRTCALRPLRRSMVLRVAVASRGGGPEQQDTPGRGELRAGVTTLVVATNR